MVMYCPPLKATQQKVAVYGLRIGYTTNGCCVNASGRVGSTGHWSPVKPGHGWVQS